MAEGGGARRRGGCVCVYQGEGRGCLECVCVYQGEGVYVCIKVRGGATRGVYVSSLGGGVKMKSFIML